MEYLKKFSFKNKEELDSMSKEEIEDFRYKFLSKSPFNNDRSDIKYLLELDVYRDIRFKEDAITMYKNWSISDNPSESFLKGVINRMGLEKFYKIHLEEDIEKVGEFQYILGI